METSSIIGLGFIKSSGALAKTECVKLIGWAKEDNNFYLTGTYKFKNPGVTSFKFKMGQAALGLENAAMAADPV